MTEPHRWLVLARHEGHEGNVSFDIGPPRFHGSRARALRQAVIDALRYFRDDEFELTDPVELPLTHTNDEVDDAMHALVDNDVTFHESSTALRRSIA